MKSTEFFEKSKKVELYPFSAQDMMMSGNYTISIASSFSGSYVSGLYFPNVDEIVRIWNLSVPKNQKTGNEVLEGVIYDVTFFTENLIRTINSPYMAQVITESFNKMEIGLLSGKKEITGNTLPIQLDRLVGIIGSIYDKIDLLNNDIRIQTLEYCSQSNKIVNFKPAVVGYIGNPVIAERKYK